MKNKANSLLLSSLIGASVLLVGCGGSDTEKQPALHAADTYQVGTYPRFDPVTSDVPFNTDLIFAKAATTDGTADLGAPTDPVRATINQLDGFSTSAYFDVLISGSVDPVSAIYGKSVFLVELDAGGKDALVPANIVGIKGLAKADVTVESLDGGTNNTLRIRPLEPLAAKSKYLVIITNDVKDASGNGLTRSWTYNALRDTTYGTINDLIPVRNAIVGWETLAKGFLANVTKQAPEVVADKLALTYTFTTTDPLASLVAVAAPRAALVTAQMNAGVSASDALDAIDLLAPSGALNTPEAVDLGVSALTGVDFNQFSALLTSGVGKLYTGYINLPSYQAPRIASGSFLTAVWQPNTHLALLLGQQLPTDVDGSVNHTYRFPFAAKQATLSRPLQVTLPEKTWIPGYAGVANCEQIYASTGYPTVIYVHGITSDRTSVLALAHTLASRCIATVAIDLPLHGVPANSAFVNALNVEKSKLIPFATLYGDKAPSEGHLNLGGSAGNPVPMNFESPTAADGSGAHFINLANLTNTRDSLRQAVVNLLYLNASLGDLSDELAADHGVGLNTDNLYVVGSSLGGIVGSVYTTVNQLAITYDGIAGFDAPFYPIKGLVTSGAGTQVSQILVNSATFAPVINGGLAASGVNAGTTNYERFMYAAQSAVDAGDPVNFLPSLKALNVPVLIQEIANDAVIPNSTSKAPLAGTAPMAALVGADKAKVGAAETTRNYVRVLAGGHASLLRPEADAPDVTAELQAQVVTFVLNQGKPVIGMAAPTQIDQ